MPMQEAFRKGQIQEAMKKSQAQKKKSQADSKKSQGDRTMWLPSEEPAIKQIRSEVSKSNKLQGLT